MALDENLDVFLADFGVSCTAGAVTALGILDMPGQVLIDGMVISTDYTLTAKAEDFGDLLYGSGISVDGVLYTVREVRRLDDGMFCEIGLQKTLDDSGVVTDPIFDGGGAAITDPTVFPGDNILDGGAA
jgi:hypothetical protein